MSFESLYDLLLVINSKIGPTSHRLATMHMCQTDKQTDRQKDNGRQPCQ